MKIFSPISPLVEAAGAEAPGGMDCRGWLYWPDSCWLLSRRPLFVPDFAPEFIAIPALAAKTGRLGKCIAERFTPRYVAAFTVALIILPARVINQWCTGGNPAPSDCCFDNALVIGDWLPSDAESISVLPDFTLRLNDGEVTRLITLSADVKELYSTLADVSKTNTLKMGDIILQPFKAVQAAAISEPSDLNHAAPAFRIFPELTAEIFSGDLNLDPMLLTHFK